MPDNDIHGCAITGAHLHVVRQAECKRGLGEVPAFASGADGFMVVRSLDVYLLEREEPGAAESDYLLVILFRAPLGLRCSQGIQ